ncbi:LOW QUALITY PROTEIN: tRNA (guanine-N(7)-)-methyltransferase non-catalytic subunit wdr4 [Phycodurus eques]|uniref:LOW QUALITY PROTEIN: tRNA (guanine-N(7)-)-methyltransferase non-catalytic subunit wdr4 n=1 Tax=Phycodurus eques TaxID=693459 RepID=UPI002ACE2F5E|nr:LOW QUALITY PROTEIN: tRNA (guanine-N(7)-)-methyltransferase non-catalytic subunit wdr4 [Phycodurus eques]
MAAIGICGEWMFLSCGTKLIAAHVKQDRKPFVFDCSTAKKKENDPKADDDNSLAGTTGSDIILAFTISPSGKVAALTDDSKRLVLFERQHCWQCVSTRWLARRGTSLAFTRGEDEVLVADKSGDVYSFSVLQPEKEGELKMGHLSMVLALTMSLDGKYIITADRDEKIRVSHLCSPYNIQSFCLGHKEFVSSLLVPSGDRHWLLSGSGDGTMKLWEYKTGRRLQSYDLKDLDETHVSKLENERVTVCHITGSPDGRHVAVQCDGVSTIRFFALKRENDEKKLVPHSRLSLPRCPLDMTFDPEGRLWVLMDSVETLLQIYTLEQSTWKCETASPELKRATAAFEPHWETIDVAAKATSRFEHLHKPTFDNVAVYMEKKQQRLEEQQKQKRRKMEPKGNGKKARKVV